MSDEPVAWRVWWQDFNGHRFGTPKPKREHKDFSERSAAEAFLASAKCGDCIATIEPRYINSAKPKQMFPDDQLPEMRKRLTA